jgi:hypothetical protein
MVASRVVGSADYIPPILQTVTLQSPDLLIDVEHQPPAAIRQIHE